MTIQIANRNLGAAKACKNDEFYTQWASIEAEMNAYLEYNPGVFSSPERVQRVKELHAAGILSPARIARSEGISVRTLYRWLALQPAAAPE